MPTRLTPAGPSAISATGLFHGERNTWDMWNGTKQSWIRGNIGLRWNMEEIGLMTLKGITEVQLLEKGVTELWHCLLKYM